MFMVTPVLREGYTRVVSPRPRGQKRGENEVMWGGDLESFFFHPFFLLFCTERKKDTGMQFYAGRGLDTRVSCSPFRTHTHRV